MKINLREDLALQKQAESQGWTIEKHIQDKKRDIPNFPLAFKKDEKVIWYCSLGWACADISKSPEHYVNHRYYETLKEAFEKE